ncbi:hypothetical protein GCM10027443_14150 [Pontibacter brevis]
MNKSAFLELIQQAANISDQQTEELEKMAATFPYCQTAHLLLAKSAYDKGSMLSTQRLRRASAYATNRQVLKRIIYTSPAFAPVFDEPVVEEQQASAPETPVTVAESAEQQQEALTVQPVAGNVVQSETLPEVAFEDEAVLEDYASEEAPAEEAYYEEEASGEAEVAAASQDDVYPVHASAEEEPATTPNAEEVIPFELAQLLTINSLNSTFTDLLAQKPDNQVPEAIAEDEAQPKHLTFPDNFREADDELAQLIAEESPVAAHGVYVLEESTPAPAVEAAFSDAEDEDAATVAGNDAEPAVAAPEKPENAPVNFAFSEIDRMYAEDTIGYWMSSSRMGEVLQLKDEVTRQRPEGFHPELILEYTKTHELEEKPEEPKAPSLHHQLNIIDQFLKLNPRLKTMNNIKMKQEPQEDLSLRNSKIKKGIASESLATIFLNQGKVKKAIKIYEQLILKNPEKKSYFVEQIEKLQNLN